MLEGGREGNVERCKRNACEGERGRGMETRTVVLIAVVAVLAVAAYFLGRGGERGGGGINASAVLISAAERAADIKTYTQESTMSIDGSLPMRSKVVVSGERKRVDVVDALGIVRAFYFLREGVYICIASRSACMQVVENQSSRAYLDMVRYAQGQLSAPNATKVRRLIDTGVIDAVGGVSEREFAGRRCDQLVYYVHFDLMGEADLRESGYDRRIAPFVSRAVVECLDKETGFLLYRSLNNTFLGELKTVEFNVTDFDPRAGVLDSEFALAGNIMNESEFSAIEAEEIDRKQCLLKGNEEERNRCLETAAFNKNSTTYCGMIEETDSRDRCYITFLSRWKDVGVCDFVEAARDDCYFEAAVSGIAPAACGKVRAVEYKALCAAVVAGEPDGCALVSRSDDCVFYIVRKSGNRSACGLIVNASMRELCAGG